MMTLYQVSSCRVDFPYVSCFVWAASEEVAQQMAAEAFRKKYGEAGVNALGIISTLMRADSPAFVTVPSDEGWEMP